jgi:hypothetical protein
LRVAGPFGCRCPSSPPCSVSTPRSSNRPGGFPAAGSPTGEEKGTAYFFALLDRERTLSLFLCPKRKAAADSGNAGACVKPCRKAVVRRLRGRATRGAARRGGTVPATVASPDLAVPSRRMYRRWAVAVRGRRCGSGAQKGHRRFSSCLFSPSGR